MTARPRLKLAFSTHSSRVCRRSPSTAPTVWAAMPSDSGMLASVDDSWWMGFSPARARRASSAASTSACWPAGTAVPEAGRLPMSSTSMRVFSLRCSSTSATNLPYICSRHSSEALRYSTSTAASSAMELTVVPPTKRPTLTVVLAAFGSSMA